MLSLLFCASYCDSLVVNKITSKSLTSNLNLFIHVQFWKDRNKTFVAHILLLDILEPMNDMLEYSTMTCYIGLNGF